MKYLNTFKSVFSLLVLGSLLSGCVVEPVNYENNKVDIKGAPDWVNRGSTFTNTRDGRMFYGVSAVSLQGDMALQKSIAEDRAKAELVKVLAEYLEVVSDEYMGSARTRENSGRDELNARQHEEATVKLIKEATARQIDEAITRQFKESVSRQFKEEVTRQIKEASIRETREAIANQTEFSLQLDDIITRQIKEAVARQLVNTAKNHVMGAKIVGSWRDVRTNSIWSVAELEMKQIKASMAGMTEMNNDLQKYFDQNTEIIFDRIMDQRRNDYSSGWNMFSPSSR